MRRGKFWPIPLKELINGSILASKNASRLTKDARFVFDNNRFSIAFVLSVHAIEEWGKCFLLLEARNNKKDVTPEVWHQEMENHDKKIDAVIRFLYKPLTYEDEPWARKYHRKIKDWLNLRLDALYLDWDGSKGMWYLADDGMLDIKKHAEEALKEVETLLERYLKLAGEFAFATTKERMEALRNGTAYCFCDACATVMMDVREFLVHTKKRSIHSGFVHWFKL